MKQKLFSLQLLLCCFLGGIVFAQQKTDLPPMISNEKKLDALGKYWNRLIDSSRYQDALSVARKGLALCLPNNDQKRAQFLYYVGYSFEYLNSNYDSAVHYYEMAYPYAVKSKSLVDETNVLMRLNYMYYYVKKYAVRDTLIQYIKTIVDTAKDLRVQAILNGSIGEYYLDNSAYENFIHYKLKAIDFRKKMLSTDSTDNRENIGVSYLQIVQAYLRMQQNEKALEYLGYGREYISKFRDGEAFLYNDYTNVYLNLDKPDSAVQYDRRLYGMMRKDDSLYINLSFSRRLFADYYVRKNQIAKAEQEALEALRLAKKSKDEEISMEANVALGKIEYKKNAYNEAIAYLNLALPSAYNYDKEMYADIQQKLGQSYAGLLQWEKAYTHYETYSHLQDTLYTEASKRTIAEAEGKYQNKEKQLQIDAQSIQISYGLKLRLWLISGLTLLSLVAILLIVIYRNKKHAADVLDGKNKKLAQLNQDLEEANQTKAKLFGIISHDLRSPISQVYQFLKLQQTNPKLLSEEQRAQLNNKIQTATGSLLETMEDLLLWSKTQMNQFNVAMQPVPLLTVIEESIKLLQLNIDAKNIDVQNGITAETLVNCDPYFLQTIVRNLLQNAIKASPQEGAIKIYFDGYNLFIQNKGGHFSQEQYQAKLASGEGEKSLSGLGLRLVDELSKKVNAPISFADAATDTTIVKIAFPKY